MEEKHYPQLVWFESAMLIALAAVWLWVMSISSSDNWQTLLRFNSYGEAVFEVVLLLGILGLGLYGMTSVARGLMTRTIARSIRQSEMIYESPVRQLEP